MNNRSNIILWIGALVVLGMAVAVGVQYTALRDMRMELAGLKSRIEVSEMRSPVSASSGPVRTVVRERAPAGTGDLAQRLALVEGHMADFARVAEYLMERGQIPLEGDDVQTYVSRFGDPSASDSDRLRALRLLRRNDGMDDSVIQTALNWLNSSTNANTRRELVERLDGLTNAALKGPLLDLAATSADDNLREEAVENLQHFMGDPAVEAKMWELLDTDPDPGVRREAAQALGRGPMNPDRIAKLEQRALDPNLPLESRLMAARTLQRSDVESPQVMASMADLAARTEDPVVRADVFRAFDGSQAPEFKDPLIYGLQDPNPVVREEAADALSGFAAQDPLVEQWLRYIADNDPDQRVRREALGSLRQLNRDR